MNRRSGYLLMLVAGLLFSLSNACGAPMISTSFGCSSGPSSYSISEGVGTSPLGSYQSTVVLGVGDGVTSQQSIQTNSADYSGEEDIYSRYGDYAKVTWDLTDATLLITSANQATSTKGDGSYALASEEWGVQSAKRIEFSAYAQNRKNYRAKVTTLIEDDGVNGGVVFNNKAEATSSAATATQTLKQAKGDKITRTLSASNLFKRSEQTITTEEPLQDYLDTAKATVFSATITPSGGSVTPSTPTVPPTGWPTGPGFPSTTRPTGWPTGPGW